MSIRANLVKLASAGAIAVTLMGAPVPTMAKSQTLSPSLGHDDSRETLSEAIDYASITCAHIHGSQDVADGAEWTRFSAELDRAKGYLDALENGVPAPSVMNLVAHASADNLHREADEVRASHNEKVAADEAARQGAEAQARAAHAQDTGISASSPNASSQTRGTQQSSDQGSSAQGSSARSSDDGAWNVQYRNEYGTAEGAADGACTQWADGYYVAHNWSESGERIAQRPGTVVVDGQRYAYVSSMVVSRDTTYDQVYAFTHANGGIGFQTCYGDGYLVTHYEPY